MPRHLELIESCAKPLFLCRLRPTPSTKKLFSSLSLWFKLFKNIISNVIKFSGGRTLPCSVQKAFRLCCYMTHGGRLCNFTIDFYVWMLFLDVGEFKTVVVLLVNEFQIASQKQGRHSEAGEDDERHGVVVWYELGTRFLRGNDCGIVGV